MENNDVDSKYFHDLYDYWSKYRSLNKEIRVDRWEDFKLWHENELKKKLSRDFESMEKYFFDKCDVSISIAEWMDIKTGIDTKKDDIYAINIIDCWRDYSKIYNGKYKMEKFERYFASCCPDHHLAIMEKTKDIYDEEDTHMTMTQWLNMLSKN